MAFATGFSRALMLAGATLLASGASAAVFDGPYVGAQIGWQQDKGDVRLNLAGSPTQTGTIKSDGFTFGGFLGYNYKVGETFVLGLEGDVSGRSGAADVAGVRVKPGVRFDLGARAGVLATPTTLVYARGGYTNQRFKASDSIDSDAKSRSGWTIGAGVEQAVMENVSARIEYDYARYRSFRYSDGVDSLSIKPKAHAIRVGVAYNF